MTVSKLTLLELVVLSLLGTLLFVVQVAFAFLPNIELVSVLIIVYTRVYGWKAFYPIYLFILIEGLFYGISTWFIHYLYVWAILALFALLFRRQHSYAFWVLVNSAYGLAFGALCALTYLFIGGVPVAVTYWIQGIPFDLLHMGGNFITGLALCEPLYQLLTRLKKQIR